MALSREVKQFYFKNMPGMNNKYEDLDLKDKWAKTAQNCRFEDEPGAVDKRDPVTYYNETATDTEPVVGLYRYYKSDGTIKFIKTCGTSTYVGDDLLGSFTSGTGGEIRSNLTDGKRMSYVTYKDLLICSNGFDNLFVYDGTADNVTWELGACKAVLGGAGGGLDASSTYQYSVTFDGDAYVTGAVSNVVTTTGTNQTIELSNIPDAPLGATNKRLYRTEGNGSTLKLLATWDYTLPTPAWDVGSGTTDTFTDTIADGSLGADLPSVTDDFPKGSILQVHRERLFISGDPDNPNKIYYSNPYLPHYIQQTNNLDYMEISPEDGDEIMGIPIQLGVMVCIKKNTIRRLHITSPTSGADPSTWYADDPVAWTGSPAQWSITQTPYGIIFLGWDGWYQFDGAHAKPVMDEFDTGDILESSYSDTVGFYHNGIFLAAYTDREGATQYHNRIMRYNLKRTKLSYDTWTSTTVSGANCFASKSGDDEAGELYYGDSQNGYVLKERVTPDVYRLATKTEVYAGSLTNIFVGGTERAPYIEPGAEETADTIDDDIIIFWDSETTTPGSGWTEITSTYDGKFIFFGATSVDGPANQTHTHTVSGSLNTASPPAVESGDQDHLQGLLSPHTHTYSGTSSATTALPRNIKLRMFKSSGATTTEFPNGAIIMWDQPTAPTGWAAFGTDGYYVRVGSTGLGTENASAHEHTFSFFSDFSPYENGNLSSGTDECSDSQHNHEMSGALDSADMADWELDHVGFTFIKKVGESDTWDTTIKYCYCPVDGSSTPTGWSAVSTYNGMYLKIGTGSSIYTGTAENGDHTHEYSSGTTEIDQQPEGNAYHRTHCLAHHTHSWSAGTSQSTSAPNPGYVQFRLFRKVLGQMKTYNTAHNVHQGTATWESPAQQIRAEGLNLMYWNEILVAGDSILFYTRSSSTEVGLAGEAWLPVGGLSDPNGDQITSTANTWFQYKIEFTAVDTTVNIPRVYFSDGYVVKYEYDKGAVNAETSVEFRYETGWRNFDLPVSDKVYKKIFTKHQATQGSFILYWETENANDQFTVDLTVRPSRWDTFFQSTAMGKELNVEVYKNDIYNFRLSEIHGLYSEEPILA